MPKSDTRREGEFKRKKKITDMQGTLSKKSGNKLLGSVSTKKFKEGFGTITDKFDDDDINSRIGNDAAKKSKRKITENQRKKFKSLFFVK